jgi:hypothetical protein
MHFIPREIFCKKKGVEKMKCKAEFRCKSCGYCLECSEGAMCPVDGIIHVAPKKNKKPREESTKIINRVQKKARPENEGSNRPRAPRNLARLYPEHQPAFVLDIDETETNFDQENLPVGQTKIKEVI